ncbi:MAG: ribosomal L7Ae/L30e/S12e/Gadd45 family protein [Candidatus Aenigmatarchaeota archaeon]
MIEEEIRKGKANQNLVIGFRDVKRNVGKNKIEKVILANNCPEDLKESIDKLSVETVQSDMNNKEIGTICGKPFNISVLGISK